MRLNEILQLDLADIRQVDGEVCFLVSNRSASGANDKRVKTTNSERYFPIHPRLMEIGFMEFVEGRRAGGGAKVFPELPVSTMGYYSDAFSKWFRRFIEKSGAAQPKTCFHSFRHNFRDGLREPRGIDPDVALTLEGGDLGPARKAPRPPKPMVEGSGWRRSSRR
jgi:integrase